VHVKIGFGEGSITVGTHGTYRVKRRLQKPSPLGGTALATEYLLILHLRGTKYDGTLRVTQLNIYQPNHKFQIDTPETSKCDRVNDLHCSDEV